MAEDVLFGEDHHDKFKASAYLKDYYENGVSDLASSLRCYHEVFQSLPSGLAVLDYGSGPVIMTAISASTKASEIILSDYTGDCRKALRQWLDRHPDAFDWSPYFSHVVKDLEGKGEEEVEERQELVRRLVKAVVHCDLTQDPPIERGYDHEYDVVMSSFCLEAVAQTSAEYKCCVAKLAKLVKPGGSLLILGLELESGTAIYPVGDLTFRSFGITTELAVEAMTEAGLSEITSEKLGNVPGGVGNVWRVIFFRGMKKKISQKK